MKLHCPVNHSHIFLLFDLMVFFFKLPPFSQVEKIICTLRPAMKLRLRFITHISKMEPASAAVTATSASQPTTVSSPAPQSGTGPSSIPLTVPQ